MAWPAGAMRRGRALAARGARSRWALRTRYRPLPPLQGPSQPARAMVWGTAAATPWRVSASRRMTARDHRARPLPSRRALRCRPLPRARSRHGRGRAGRVGRVQEAVGARMQSRSLTSAAREMTGQRPVQPAPGPAATATATAPATVAPTDTPLPPPTATATATSVPPSTATVRFTPVSRSLRFTGTLSGCPGGPGGCNFVDTAVNRWQWFTHGATFSRTRQVALQGYVTLTDDGPSPYRRPTA